MFPGLDECPSPYDMMGVHVPEERTRPGFKATRRGFMGGALAVGGIYLVATFPESRSASHHAEDSSATDDTLRFFTAAEAATVDAVLARLIPGDSGDPGAVEAGVLFYIDHKLAEYEFFAEPTYVRGPFAQEPEAAMTADGESVVVEPDQLYRYGFQSDMFPREVYRDGLKGLDRYSRQLHGVPFGQLDGLQQDQILEVLDDIDLSGEPDGPEEPPAGVMQQVEEAFGDVAPGGFFDRFRTDAIEGMFSDPKYGGNRDYLGWALIGYPGARRAWSPEEMMAPGMPRRPQPLDELPAMHPDKRDNPAGSTLQQAREGVKDG